MKPGVRKVWVWGALTAVAAVVAGYLGGVPAVFLAVMAGFVLYNITRPDSDRKYSGGTGVDDYDGGHDGGHNGGHNGGHGGDHGGDGGGSG